MIIILLQSSNVLLPQCAVEHRTPVHFIYLLSQSSLLLLPTHIHHKRNNVIHHHLSNVNIQINNACVQINNACSSSPFQYQRPNYQHINDPIIYLIPSVLTCQLKASTDFLAKNSISSMENQPTPQ